MPSPADEFFYEDRHGIVYRERAAPFVSVIIACVSVGLLFPTTAFLTAVLSWPWHSGKIAGLLTVLIFYGCSVFAGLIACAAAWPQHVHFDAETRRVHGRVRGRLLLSRLIDTSFASLQEPVVRDIEQEAGNDLFTVRIERAGHLALDLGVYDKRSHAQYWRARLDLLLKI